MDDPRFLTVPEVAAILRVEPKTVIKKIKAGRLVAILPGKRYLIDREALETYIAGCRLWHERDDAFPWPTRKKKGPK